MSHVVMMTDYGMDGEGTSHDSEAAMTLRLTELQQAVADRDTTVTEQENYIKEMDSRLQYPPNQAIRLSDWVQTHSTPRPSNTRRHFLSPDMLSCGDVSMRIVELEHDLEDREEEIKQRSHLIREMEGRMRGESGIFIDREAEILDNFKSSPGIHVNKRTRVPGWQSEAKSVSKWVRSHSPGALPESPFTVTVTTPRDTAKPVYSRDWESAGPFDGHRTKQVSVLRQPDPRDNDAASTHTEASSHPDLPATVTFAENMAVATRVYRPPDPSPSPHVVRHKWGSTASDMLAESLNRRQEKADKAARKMRRRQERGAATTIQCMYRCMRARERLKQLRQDYNDMLHGAAMMIQCCYRGHCAWIKYQKMLYNHRKAIEHAARRRVEDAAAVRIQTIVRAMIARQQLKQLRRTEMERIRKEEEEKRRKEEEEIKRQRLSDIAALKKRVEEAERAYLEERERVRREEEEADRLWREEMERLREEEERREKEFRDKMEAMMREREEAAKKRREEEERLRKEADESQGQHKSKIEAKRRKAEALWKRREEEWAKKTKDWKAMDGQRQKETDRLRDRAQRIRDRRASRGEEWRASESQRLAADAEAARMALRKSSSTYARDYIGAAVTIQRYMRKYLVERRRRKPRRRRRPTRSASAHDAPTDTSPSVPIGDVQGIADTKIEEPPVRPMSAPAPPPARKRRGTVAGTRRPKSASSETETSTRKPASSETETSTRKQSQSKRRGSVDQSKRRGSADNAELSGFARQRQLEYLGTMTQQKAQILERQNPEGSLGKLAALRAHGRQISEKLDRSQTPPAEPQRDRSKTQPLPPRVAKKDEGESKTLVHRRQKTVAGIVVPAIQVTTPETVDKGDIERQQRERVQKAIEERKRKRAERKKKG